MFSEGLFKPIKCQKNKVWIENTSGGLKDTNSNQLVRTYFAQFATVIWSKMKKLSNSDVSICIMMSVLLSGLNKIRSVQSANSKPSDLSDINSSFIRSIFLFKSSFFYNL